MTFNQVALDFDLLDVPDNFAYWFSGFVDGEGSFNINIKKKNRGAYCRLVIGLRDDDIDILYQIRDVLKVGTVTRQDLQKLRDKGIKAGNQAKWTTENIGDIRWVIIPLLEKYPLRTKKRIDFDVWKQAAMLIHCGGHLTQNGREQLQRLKIQLENGRKYKLESL